MLALVDVDLRQSDPGDGVAFTSLKMPNSHQFLNGTEDHGACALTLMFSIFACNSCKLKALPCSRKIDPLFSNFAADGGVPSPKQ